MLQHGRVRCGDREPAPPYGRMESLKEVKIYLKSHYKSDEERADLYTSFIERGHKILKNSRLFGMI